MLSPNFLKVISKLSHGDMVDPRLSQSYPKFANFVSPKVVSKWQGSGEGWYRGRRKGVWGVSFIIIEEQRDLCWVGQLWIALRVPDGYNRY